MNGNRRGVFGILVLAALGVFWTGPAIGALPPIGEPPVSRDELSYYQLRDVSGVRDGHTIAGSQWFATVVERWRDPEEEEEEEESDSETWISYWDTRGGQAPDVKMVTSADLLSDMKSVYLGYALHDDISPGDDASFDPIESVALVIKEGSGVLSLDFGNDYTHHSSRRPQDVMEDVLPAMTESEYTAYAIPREPELVASGDWLHTELHFQALSPQNYGSSLGYLTFRQSGSFDQGNQGFRESINIPLVVANVYDGPASDAGNELRFDITVLDGENVVTRKKFLWGADREKGQSLGTFFFIQQPDAEMPVYALRGRVTNRTGTRYRRQRYDAPQQDIVPDHWLYDIPPDRYGTLPERFYLDSQSQIAPGLVTQYSVSMDMTHTSRESFRLYPFQGTQPPSDLHLTFVKVRGMTPYGSPLNGRPERGAIPWTAAAFRMIFTDVAGSTEEEIEGYAGGRPVMPDSSYTFEGAGDDYIKSSALSAVTLSAGVPEGLLAASDDIALLPVRMRLRISREESLIDDEIWNDLENAGLENAESVLDVLARTCAVWVRSPNTVEKDMNLFTAGSAPRRCVQAFTYENFLYIDFIALVADAKSQKPGYTAFCEVVEDDGVPYILLGDGEADGAWTLSFFLDRTGEAPVVGPDEPGTDEDSDTGEDSGGGCSAGLLSVSGLLYLAFLVLPRGETGPASRTGGRNPSRKGDSGR